MSSTEAIVTRCVAAADLARWRPRHFDRESHLRSPANWTDENALRPRRGANLVATPQDRCALSGRACCAEFGNSDECIRIHGMFPGGTTGQQTHFGVVYVRLTMRFLAFRILERRRMWGAGNPDHGIAPGFGTRRGCSPWPGS
ncbi:hypothetical protein BRAS3809_5100014 [Bradyrhizobium sp. STM 3809]|nr:hypothetical protein BRAS3809_5100014 [Bradyrhizobium sp. STM 3809]